MAETIKITVPMYPGGICPVVHLSQYDTAQTIEADLVGRSDAFDVEDGSTVTIRGTKPDNTGYEYTMTASGSVATVQVQSQMTVLAGRYQAEIRVTDTAGITSSGNLLIDVEPSALDDDTTVSDTELPLIEQAAQAAPTVTAAAEEAAASAAAAKTSETNAAASETAAASSASAAASSASAAATSEENAADSATAANASKVAAATSATQGDTNQKLAKTYATQAAASATAAATSETNAAASATAAAESAEEAKQAAEFGVVFIDETATVSTSGWTSATESSVTYYKQTITLTKSYIADSVTVNPATVMTAAQKSAWMLVDYITIDDSDGKTLTIRAAAAPSTAFTIEIRGVEA